MVINSTVQYQQNEQSPLILTELAKSCHWLKSVKTDCKFAFVLAFVTHSCGQSKK
jgi:hypothetical protein